MEQSLKLKNTIEVALLTSGRPLSIDELQKLFEERIERSTIRMLLDEIKSEWSEKTMELVLVANGYRFEAKPIFSDSLMRLSPERVIKYSRAGQCFRSYHNRTYIYSAHWQIGFIA